MALGGGRDVLGSPLLALAASVPPASVFQTTTQSQMLTLSDIEYHGRMQSMVVLGFSGFGLAALPLGLLADAVTLEVTLVLMGGVVLAVTSAFTAVRRARTGASCSRSSWPSGRAPSSRRRGTSPPTARRCGRP